MNILYDKNLLAKYDNNFYSNYLFVNELNENNKYKLLKHTRKIISTKELSKYIYISTLNINISDYGYLLKTCDTLIYLNKVGDNIFYISYIEGKNKLAIYSILYTFMNKYDCYVDVNKYTYLFDQYMNIFLHKTI